MLMRQIVSRKTQEDFMKLVFCSDEPDGTGPTGGDDDTWGSD
jgi:hypothetical protein